MAASTFTRARAAARYSFTHVVSTPAATPDGGARAALARAVAVRDAGAGARLTPPCLTLAHARAAAPACRACRRRQAGPLPEPPSRLTAAPA